MSFKVPYRGVMIEVSSLEEVRALTHDLRSVQPDVPKPPMSDPPRKPLQAVYVPPKPAEALPGALPPLPKVPGHRFAFTISDAARAVGVAFQKHGKPVSYKQIKHFLEFQAPTTAALLARLAKACNSNMVKRVAAGVYVPVDYDPSPVEGLKVQTQKALPKLASVVLQYLLDPGTHKQFGTKIELAKALSIYNSGKESTYRLNIWAAKRLGWIDTNFEVTQAGLDAAAAV